MQCRDRHKSFVFNIRDACFIMKMKNVKKIDMNKKLYEQIKALLADKLDEKEQKELFHHREFEERMHLQWNMDRQKELDDEVGRKMWKMVRQKCLDCRKQKIQHGNRRGKRNRYQRFRRFSGGRLNVCRVLLYIPHTAVGG